MSGGRHHLVPGSHWRPAGSNIVRNVVSDVTVRSHRAQLSGVGGRRRVGVGMGRVARARTIVGEEMLRWRSSRRRPGVSGSRSSWGSKLHLQSGVHLFVVVQVEVLQVLHVHLLLFLPGHHLRLLSLLGREGLSSSVVCRPDCRQVEARDTSRVRDSGGRPRAGRRPHQGRRRSLLGWRDLLTSRVHGVTSLLPHPLTGGVTAGPR